MVGLYVCWEIFAGFRIDNLSWAWAGRQERHEQVLQFRVKFFSLLAFLGVWNRGQGVVFLSGHWGFESWARPFKGDGGVSQRMP